MNVIELTIYLATGIGVLCAFSQSASANNSKHILEELQKHDFALSQGTVIYTTNSKNIIHYANSNTQRPQQSNKNTLYYTADGRYHKKTEPLAGNGVPCEEISDGTDNIMVVGLGNTQVIFDRDTPSSHMASTTNIVPGPSFAMGRGLSTLKNIDITDDTNGVHLSGVLRGSKIEALLDPNHDYVAKEIILTGDEQATIKKLKWQLNTPKNYNGSPFIATDSTYKLETQILSGTHHCVIQDADFSQPNEAILTYDWHKPGLQITDNRMGPYKSINYQSSSLPPGITSSQLLTMTKQELVNRTKRRFTEKAIVFAVVAGFAITAGTIAFFTLKRDR